MTITIEEVKKLAIECGIVTPHNQNYYEAFPEELQAFYQRAYEDGRKMQREKDKYIYVVANRTGSQVFAEEKDADEFMSTFPALIAGGLTKVKVEVIRNNTGE